jgi:hypothetical protein
MVWLYFSPIHAGRRGHLYLPQSTVLPATAMLEERGGGRPLSVGNLVYVQDKTHALYALYCRLVKTAPCIAVYTSSLTIVAIALDRHRVIVHSGRQQVFPERLETPADC